MPYRVPSAPHPAGQVETDETDRAIITALCEQGRLSMRALAERVHVSRANAYARVARLEQLGVITGYTAVIDPDRVGHGISAYVYLRIAQQSWKSVRAQIRQLPEVEHAALMSGEDDLALLVRATDAASLRELVLHRFQAMPEVLSTKTVLILDEVRV